MSRFGDTLDNYITGHYGEDQYPDEPEPDPAENIPEIVSVCEELNCDCCMDLDCPHNKYDGKVYVDGPPKLYKVYQNKKGEYYIHLRGKRFYFFKPVGKGTWTMRD